MCFALLREDVSTDGRWCYVVFWVVKLSASMNIQWENLKNRLMSICPSCSIPFYFDLVNPPTSAQVYLLKLFSVDRKGLLHGNNIFELLVSFLSLEIGLLIGAKCDADVTQVLCELELLIHWVKVSTTPDGRVVDLFFITDGM